MSEVAPTADQVGRAYNALLDPVMRAAHRALLEHARLTREDGWPTPDMVVAFAGVYAVPAASLGALFGLLAYRDAGRTVWVDAVRGPVHPAAAITKMSDDQALAFGFLKCTVS